MRGCKAIDDSKLISHLERFRKGLIKNVQLESRGMASRLGQSIRRACPGGAKMKSSIKWKSVNKQDGAVISIYSDYQTITTEGGQRKVLNTPLAIFVLEYGRARLPASPIGRPLKVKGVIKKYTKATEAGGIGSVASPAELKKWSAEGYVVRKGSIAGVKGTRFIRNTWSTERPKLEKKVIEVIVNTVKNFQVR